jgi:hypothetical protein
MKSNKKNIFSSIQQQPKAVEAATDYFCGAKSITEVLSGVGVECKSGKCNGWKL